MGIAALLMAVILIGMIYIVTDIVITAICFFQKLVKNARFRRNCRQKIVQANYIPDGMSLDRWTHLMENDIQLSPDELAAGWHWCPDWDDLLVGPGMGELDHCTCTGAHIEAARHRAKGRKRIK